MTNRPARKPPALSIVADDLAPEPNASLPVPTAPVLDEEAVYIQQQQADLAKTESDLWLVDADIAAVEQERERRIALINAEYDATMQALRTRRGTLARKQSRIQAALKAYEDETTDE